MVIDPSNRRVFDGFGYTERGSSVFATPRSAEELAELFGRCAEQKLSVALRGNGRSYGDAAMNRGGVVLDLREMKRLLSFDEEQGIVEVEPGLLLTDLWRVTLPAGFWTPVSTGTSFPTLGGMAAMNVHGKNHYKAGSIGDHILELDLVTPDGRLLTLQPADPLFKAVISGFGTLGAITRIKLKLKRVHGGRLKVWQFSAPSWAEQFEAFESCQDYDYFVSWVDMAIGEGRGQLHKAKMVEEGEDPEGAAFMDPQRQEFPKAVLGVPVGLVPLVLGAFFSHDLGLSLTNEVKYRASQLGSTQPFYQAHAAFHFLLDQLPGFRNVYGPAGFIQFQPFVPTEHAPRVFAEILRRTKASGHLAYLGVLKRHRPDDFLFSYALDGYSIALDFPARGDRAGLWRLCGELADLVLEAGGRFYPAKDSTLRADQVRRAWGQDRLERWAALRREVDPAGVLRTELAARWGMMP